MDLSASIMDPCPLLSHLTFWYSTDYNIHAYIDGLLGFAFCIPSCLPLYPLIVTYAYNRRPVLNQLPIFFVVSWQFEDSLRRTAYVTEPPLFRHHHETPRTSRHAFCSRLWIADRSSLTALRLP
jgi:hypothetical protein